MTTAKSSSSGVCVSLNNVDMWQKFHPFTEMLVTRSGRKLFPELEVNIKGLVPDALYTVSLYLERVNNIKYKFTKDKSTGTGIWEEESIVKHTFPIEKRQHMDGGMVGAHWTSSPVSFSRSYITNNSNFDKNSKIKPFFVESMHRYQPVVTVKNLDNGFEEEFRLTMTKFMAVAAYQNPIIVDLKKQNNKFSAGFLPGGKHYKRSQEGTPRGRKRAIVSKNSDSTPPSTVTSPTKTASKKPKVTPAIVLLPTKTATPPAQQSMLSHNQAITPPIVVMTPHAMVLPPSMTSTPMVSSIGVHNNFQNPIMTPFTVVTPPLMASTWMTPPSVGLTGFQNQMAIPPVPAHHSAMNQYYNPYGMWNMPQMIVTPMPPPFMMPGINHFHNFAQFGNPADIQQVYPYYPNFNGAGTSSQHCLNCANFYYRY